jgi:hypothetical protein
MRSILPERVAEHVGMQLRHPDDRRLGEPTKPTGRRVPVHPRPAAVEQDRPAYPVGDGGVDRSSDRWRERHQCYPVAFAVHPQDAVAVFFAKVGDVAAGGFEERRGAEESLVPGRRRGVVADGDAREQIHGHDVRAP